MPDYKIISTPSAIPVPGSKVIEEYLGRMNSGDEQLSVARMIAPPGWDEPPQTPEFDEVNIVVRGKMNIKIGEENLIVSAGEVILTYKGTTVQYSNPFKEEYECWSVCVPAFSPDSVNRDF